MKAGFTVLHGRDSLLDGFQVAAVPFVGTSHAIKLLSFDAATLQHLVHLLVVKGHDHAITHENGYLRIKQLIGYASSLRVLPDALMGSLLQGFSIAEKIAAVIFVNGGLSYFQTVTMPFVIDGENINQL